MVFELLHDRLAKLVVVDVNPATTRTANHYVNTLWIIVVVLRHTAAHFLKRLKEII